MTDIKISIVLYKNDKSQVLKAISSVLTNKLDVELHLLDNSPDDRLRVLDQIDHRILYVFNDNNPGFGTAHNIALRRSIKENTKYHLVMNPDVYFNPTVLEGIFYFMEENKTVGNLMPKVLNLDGSIQHLCKLLPSPINLISRLIIPQIIHQRTKLNNAFELRFWKHDQVANIPSLSGCFMFFRVDAIRKVGIFDENIFMYIEDLDLNRRIHNKYKTVFFPHEQIFHEHNRESFRSIKLLIIHLKSAIYYFNKWGWLCDNNRKIVNRETLANLKN